MKIRAHNPQYSKDNFPEINSDKIWKESKDNSLTTIEKTYIISGSHFKMINFKEVYFNKLEKVNYKNIYKDMKIDVNSILFS